MDKIYKFILQYFLDEKNIEGNTPFIQCILDNHILLCNTLLSSKINLQKTNFFEHDALYICIILNKYKIGQKIIKKITIQNPYLFYNNLYS